MKTKHVKCPGLSSQGLMAAPGMIQNTQTPWHSNDHLSYQNFSETTHSLPRQYISKTNIFPNSIKALCRVK